LWEVFVILAPLVGALFLCPIIREKVVTLAKWTEKQKQKILALAEASTIREAAKKSGVPEGTIKRWRSEQRSRSEPNQERTEPKKRTEPEPNQATEDTELTEELTEKQKLFAEIYVNNFNATQAAIKAGYSPVSAKAIGCENLTKPNVRKYIDYLKEIKKFSIMLNVDDIVERYMRIAFSDITDFVDFGTKEFPIITESGIAKDKHGNTLTETKNTLTLKSSEQVDGGLIAEIRNGKQGASIKLEDRQKALSWLSDFFEFNPEHRHKKAHDEKKLQLERERFEHSKKMDEMKVF